MLDKTWEFLERTVPVVAFSLVLTAAFALQVGGVRAANPIDMLEPNSGECLCGMGGISVTFGHGYRHLSGTGLPRTGVESHITTHVRSNPVPAVGTFWKRYTYYGQGWTIEYHAYRVNLSTVHVGTYYPLR